MTTKPLFQICMQKFVKVMNKYMAQEKKPRLFKTDDLLYRAEIHTIEAIGKQQGINVTELAQSLGITKGAVSQMIDKLIKKDLVNKSIVASAENEVSLELTHRGVLVFEEHEDYHQEMNEELSRSMDHLSEEQIQVFLGMMDSLEHFLDQKNDT